MRPQSPAHFNQFERVVVMMESSDVKYIVAKRNIDAASKAIEKVTDHEILEFIFHS